VKARTLELGIPVLQPERLRSQARKEVSQLGAELLVCVAYGKLFGPKFLDLFPRGAINLHPSLLPRHRGPAPIVSTILNGDQVFGISVQQLSLEMDAGDILVQERVPLRDTETAGELTECAAHRGARLLREVVDSIAQGSAVAVPQLHDDATTSHKVEKEHGAIDFYRPADQIAREVRAYNPWPGAYTHWKGQRLNIHRAYPYEHARGSVSNSGAGVGTVYQVDKATGILIKTGLGTLVVEELQLQGKKALHWKEFLNGHRDFVGSVLGR
jgi:methionyl-tRNA formyltransferase